MEKYTPEMQLAIKRDVQKAQDTLALVLQQIEERNEEKRVLDAVLDEKRSLVARFEDMMLGVFFRRDTEKQEKERYIVKLDSTIKNLEDARDLLNAEVSLRKNEVPESEGSVLVQSLIDELHPILDKLLNNIDVSEAEVKALADKKSALQEATKNLAVTAEEHEQKIADAKVELEAINKKRDAVLKEMAREKNQLKVIRQRERDSSAMHRRLSDEYIKVYATLPRRNRNK